jgi:hypothetical protein
MKNSSTQAQAAKAIKAELKAAFPSISFSVRAESASMMTAVNISWTNGATTSEVKAITDKYQYGKFDGMTDSYDNNNKIEGLPQVKFVSVSRQICDTAKAEILKLVVAENNLPEDTQYNDFLKDQGDYVAALVHRFACKHSFQLDGVHF